MSKWMVLDANDEVLGFYAEDIHGPRLLPIYGPAPQPTEDDPSPVAPQIGTEPNPAYPAGCVEISDEAWQDFLDNQGRRRWNPDTSAFDAIEPPPVPPSVPISVSKLGLLRALRQKGDWSKVKADLAASEDLQEDWDAAQTISRTDRLTESMIATMSYNAAEVDALMIQAEALAT